jgi:hypothetical protein
MGKRLLILFLLLLLHISDKAQILTFQKTFGGTGLDYAYDMMKTSDGGYVLGGINMSPPNIYGSSYIVKTDANGDTLWTIVFGDTCGQYINDIYQNTDGGFITGGGKFACSISGFGEIARLDANGNVIWAKYFSSYTDPYPVIQDNADNFVIGGYVNGIGAGGDDAPIMKLNGNGDTIWSRNYGGTANDWFYHILQTPDNGYLAAGYTTSFGQGGRDIYLVKVDYNGNLLWSKTYGTAVDERAFGHCVQITSDGGFIITGGGNNGGQGIFLLKTDASGNMLWARSYDGLWGHAIKETPDHGFLICGSVQANTYKDIVLIKTDAAGTVLWSKTYGGSNESESGWILDFANDGGYVLGGWTSSFTGSEDMYFIKTDSSGNSGCNEANVTVTSNNYPLIETNPATIVTIGANTISYPVDVIRKTTVTNLCTTVGIEESIKTDNLNVYPNPFSTETILKISSSIKIQNAELKIFNVLGNEVREISGISSNEIVFERKNLQSGIYFYSLSERTIIYAYGKLIIE